MSMQISIIKANVSGTVVQIDLSFGFVIRTSSCSSTQSVFTCLKLTTKTLEQGVKYVQS